MVRQKCAWQEWGRFNYQGSCRNISKNAETGRSGDIVRPEQRVVIVKGGRGGRGNARFMSNQNKAPAWLKTGTREELWIILELKLLADVGLLLT